MSDDAELLRRYAEGRDEAAFAEVVERHVGLVYGAALRQLGGAVHRAQDVTQSVFIDLARQAGKVARRTEIVGWLYTSTHYAAAKLKRGEQRRQAREQEAQDMHEVTGAEDNLEWERVRPVLDEAMLALSERDREALLLRFFQGRRLGEVGRRLGVSEDAARMRVERGLEKLRTLLGRRGIVSTGAALAGALEAGAATTAPAGLAATVTGAVTAGAAGGAAAGLFTMTTLTMIGAGALAVAGATGFALQVRANADTTREIAALRGEVAQVAALRRENAELGRTLAEIEALRVPDGELARLRREAAALRRQAEPASRAVTSDPRLSHSGSNGAEVVTLRLPKADLATAFSAYEIYAGKKIVRDPSLAGMRGVVDIETGLLTKQEALELLRRFLRDQANVVIETWPDGTIVAKRGSAP